MRATLVVVALVAVVVAGARCKRANGAYCDERRPCPSGMACDPSTFECHVAPPGSDLGTSNIDMAGCNCSATTPICVAMSCVSCLSTSDPEGACAAVSPSTPHCLTMGNDAGSCVACRDPSDCPNAAMPYCDTTTHMCRGCVADSECPSLVCDLIPTSSTHNTCIPISMVEYVDKNAATNGNGLTPTTPRQMLMDGFNHATGGDNRKYLHVAAASYAESLNIGNKTISIVGADGTIIAPTMMDAIGVSSGGSVTLRNVTVTAANGNGGNCQGGSFAAYRSQFVGSKQNGIFASNCALTVDGVWIDSNSLSGIYVATGNFTVINSIITRNSDGGFVQSAGGTAVVFANNTVADNSASATYAAVSCASMTSLNVVNSILYNNKGTAGSTIGETDCAQAYDASDDGSLASPTVVLSPSQPPGFKGGTPVTAASYHITSTSPCRHQASPLYAPNHDFDFQPRSSTMPDIGADEAQ